MEMRTVHSVAEAVETLAEHGERCQVLAGGTDVMIQLGRGELSPGLLLHIERIGELARAEVNGLARVGALVTHHQLVRGALGGRYRAVAAASATCGGLQTQAVGTIGGNVCNASPAADSLPALLVHDAQVTLVSAGGERTVPLDEFVVGRRATTRRPDELLTSLTLAAPGARSGDVYLKVGRRSAMEVAIVGLAMRLALDDAGTVTDARVALASVGPRPLRSRAAEAALVGAVPLSDDPATGAALSAAAEALLAEISPVDDLRASAEYRRRLVPGLLRRAARTCAARARDTGEGAHGEGESRWN
jgi:aerobic carbon-monoxide dehydrogenase medium subunit